MAEQEKDVLEEEQTDIPTDPDECETEKMSETAEEEVENAALEEEEAPTGDAPEKGESRADKKAFKKQAKLDKKAEAAKEQIAQLEDKVKRQLAEFENFRNRTEKEKQAMIEKILPVVDNFERGLATVSEEKKEDPFVDGMNRIYRQLLTELENMGVKPIEAVGQEFDPNLHNAVMQVESEEYESGVVAQELQKGYTYRDSVVRHSMVAVTT